MPYLVTINDRGFALDDMQFGDLESRVLAAVRLGGDFLDIVDRNVGPLRVLVTAKSSVQSRRQSKAEELATYDIFADVSFIDLA